MMVLLSLMCACADASTGETSKSQTTRPRAVVVRLAIPFVPEATLSPASVRRQRAAIRRAQAGLLESLQPFDVRVTARYTTSPLIALVVDAAALKSLRRSPLVRKVQENRTEPPS
jgi:hypothetical protein